MEKKVLSPPDKTKNPDANSYAGSGLSAGEQNRLIQAHMDLVPALASQYRGRRGIPFDELQAEGMVGLVLAARMWQQRAGFVTYATHKIHSALLDFINRWEEGSVGVLPDDILEQRIHEWQDWQFFPFEIWPDSFDPFAALDAYEQIERKRYLFGAAFLSLKPRERAMVHAKFLRDPPATFDSIARYHKVSYMRVNQIIKRAIEKMREVIENIETNTNA